VRLQWTKTSGLADSSYLELHASEHLLLARVWDSSNGGRVFLTSDEGASWSQSSAADTDIDILSIALLGSDQVLAGTWNGLYRSASGGKSWEPLTPAGIPEDTAIRSLATLGSQLFAGTTGAVFRSTDGGHTWSELEQGIPTGATVVSIVGSGTRVFAGTDSGVLVMQGGETSWTTANSGLTDSNIAQLAVAGTRLFAVTSTGVFVSDDGATSWSADRSTLPGVNGYLALTGALLAGTEGGAYFSSDGGTSWSPLGAGPLDGTRIWSLAAGSDSLWAGTDSGVWRASCNRN
jgi:ligand-binding sensor domain-containing protein